MPLLMPRLIALAFISVLVAASCTAAPVSYHLTTRNGRTVITSSDGQVLPWGCYGLRLDRNTDTWSVKQEGFIQAGIHVYQLALWYENGQSYENPFFSIDGKPVTTPRRPISWPNMAKWLLARDPEARFILRFGLHPPPEWQKTHADDLPAPPPDMRRHDGWYRMPSMASEQYLRDCARMLTDVVTWAEQQPWRDRIIGYSCFPAQEGATEVALEGWIFDTSPRMQEAFRRFVQEKYTTDDALRQAWRDQAVTRETVTVPTRAEWLTKRETQRLQHWPNPSRVQRERDYFLLQQQLFHRFWGTLFTTLNDATAARPCLKGFDIFKQHMQGWMLQGGFNANWPSAALHTYNSINLASGALGIAPLLDHPGLDMLQTPAMYFNRGMGYGWEAEGLTDSLTLRNKVNWMEADMRTWIMRDYTGEEIPPEERNYDAGAFMTPAEMRAGFDRTLGWALSRNQMFYYMSVVGNNWFYHAPPMWEKIAQQRRIIDASVHMPYTGVEDSICLVVDDESPLYEDFSSGYQYLAVYRQLEEGLAMCGVPYRIHLLSDLAKENFPDYKCYLFPNLFKLDARTEALLREKVFRNGHVAIFGPATGITDGDDLSADGATRLLGVPMQLSRRSCPRRVMLQDHGHPISRRLPAMTFGDSYDYGPLLTPAATRIDDPKQRITELGSGFFHYYFERPGLFVRDMGRGGRGAGGDARRGAGDYAVVFSAAAPLPPELLRESARYAGCHIWSDKNAVVYAAGDFLAVHAVTGGEHRIHLPRKTAVWDLSTNTQLAKPTTELRLNITPPATYLLYLGQPPAAKP